MTRTEALKHLVESFKVDAHRTCVDCDPGAGSTYEYTPAPDGLGVLTALLGRQATEDDLRFCMSTGYNGDCYHLLPTTIDEIVWMADAPKKASDALLLELYELCRHLQPRIGRILTTNHERRIRTALGLQENAG